MTTYTSADQLLRPGEVGLFIFMRGSNFLRSPDSSGHTAWWVVDPLRRVDWVFIYLDRDDKDRPNELYMAKCGDFQGRKRNGKYRYKIQLRSINPVGDTHIKWQEFARTGTFPIRYLGR